MAIERFLPDFLFAPKDDDLGGRGAGGRSREDDDPDENEDDEEDDDEEDDDPDADKTEEELRAELRTLRASNDKNRKNSARNYRRRKELEAQLNAPKGGGDKDKGKGGDVDLDAERETARRAGLAEGENRAKRSEVKAALIAKGVDPKNVRLLIGQVKLDDLEFDDDGDLDLDDAIDDLKTEYPSMFGGKSPRRRVAGDSDDGKGGGGKKLSATEMQARALLGRK